MFEFHAGVRLVRRLSPLAGLFILAAVAACTNGVSPGMTPSSVDRRPAATAATRATTPTAQPVLTTGEELLHFQVIPGESEARFTVAEMLAGRSLTNITGSTRDVTGELNIREDGTLSATPSVIRVDLRTLKTDIEQRDEFIRGARALATEQFPTAEFILTRVDGVPVPYRDGTEVRLRLTGLLKIRGIERETTWEGPVRRENGRLTGAATTVLNFDDLQLSPPDILNFVRVQDPLTLQVQIVARQQ